MKKLFLSIFIVALTFSFCFSQENVRTYPSQGLQVFLGLDDKSSPPIVLDGRASDIQNINLDITGAATKRKGYELVNTYLDTNKTGDDFEAVIGLYEFYKSGGTRYLIAVNGSRVFYDNNGTWSQITGTVITKGQNNQFVWTTALDNAIATNDVNIPFKWSGTGNTAALSFSGLTSAVTKVKCIAWWKNYLFVGNTYEGTTERPTRIRWSDVGLIETWSDDEFIDISTLGGQEIEAFGLLYDNLFVFLTDSIYKVTLVGGDELFNVVKVTEGIGCIAKNSVQNVQIGNAEGLIFLSRDKTINYFDGVRVSKISTLIENTMNGLSAARLPYAVSADDQVNSHYYLAVTDGTASANNLLLDYNYLTKEWSKHTQIDANVLVIANDTNTNPRVHFGNYDSFVYMLNDPDLDSDIVGITGVVDRKTYIGTPTATGLMAIIDSDKNFSTATGAIIRITGGTGAGQESVIVDGTATGVCVITNAFSTVPDSTSAYSVGDIDSYYTTKWYDLGLAPMRKNFLELFLWHTTDTNTEMSIYFATDFASTILSSDVTMNAEGSLWGTAIWGVSTWGGVSTSLTRIPLNVSGRFIKFKFAEPTINEPMKLLGYSIAGYDESLF